ncbi:carbohydrate ABC transporter permease [Nonomuraea sp. K274]|uniref:Carbohydrate ABC transporter permease n=1 Tax=Nonomuraea cypriaca TaxID=1187855 RepID=A0A931AJC1_9ACTN|nr:carbohydrate ABC transporter permease [Nonomuraea cypriaca]
MLWSWKDLMWPLIVNTEPEKMTLSAGLSALRGEHVTEYPVLMAGSLMATVPIIVIFVVLQRQLIAGIAFTGSK